MTAPLQPGPAVSDVPDDLSRSQFASGYGQRNQPAYVGGRFRIMGWQSSQGIQLCLIQALNSRGGYSTVAAVDDSGTVYEGNPKTPALVASESVAVAANVGKLANPPLLIRTVQVTAVGGGGGALAAYTIIDKGSAPAAGQVAVDDAGNTLTFAAADKVTTALVTYIRGVSTNFINQGWSPP